jgi:hypothetical protein
MLRPQLPLGRAHLVAKAQLAANAQLTQLVPETQLALLAAEQSGMDTTLLFYHMIFGQP